MGPNGSIHIQFSSALACGLSFSCTAPDPDPVCQTGDHDDADVGERQSEEEAERSAHGSGDGAKIEQDVLVQMLNPHILKSRKKDSNKGGCGWGRLAQWKTVHFVIILAIGNAFESHARIFSSAINNSHYMLDFESLKYVDPHNLESEILSLITQPLCKRERSPNKLLAL